MKYKFILFLLFYLFFSAGYTHAATYFVSPSGNDSSNGSQSTPWKTLSKASNSVVAGDTVNILAGTYSGPLTISRSGTAPSPIHFVGAGIGSTIIDGGNNGITASGSPSYVKVGNLTVKNSSHDGIAITTPATNLTFASNLTFENISIEGVGFGASGSGWTNGNGVRLENTSYIFFRNVRVYDPKGNGVKIARSDHILLDHSLIEYANGSARGNALANIDNIDCFLAQNSQYIVIKNSTAHACGEDGWDFGLHEIYAEEEELMEDMAHVALRGNLAYDTNNKNYCMSDGLSPENAYDISLAHNIGYRATESNVRTYEAAQQGFAANNTFTSARLGFNIIQGASMVGTCNAVYGNSTNLNPNSTSGNVVFTSNYTGSNPQVDSNFHPLPGSPLIDACPALTRTNAACNGRIVPMSQTGFFFDGYGITEGDLIAVGDDNNLRVTRIINATSLEVDRNITCASGEAVTFAYAGSGSDIGAVESGFTAPTPNPTHQLPTSVPQDSPTQQPPTIQPTEQPATVATIQVESCTLSSGWVIANGAISQSTALTSPEQGQTATCQFTVPQAGEYMLEGLVRTPHSDANSFFINVNTTPTVLNIWDILPLTSGFALRTVSSRGTSAPNIAQFNPMVFTLGAGTHTLRITGREGGTYLDSIAVKKIGGISGCIRGDFNCSGSVGLDDFNRLVATYGQQGTNLVADLDGNGNVGLSDFNIFVSILTAYINQK